MREHAFGIEAAVAKDLLYLVGRRVAIHAHAHPHRVEVAGVGEIDDCAADDRRIGDVEVMVVIGAQAGRAPVDLDDLGVLVFDDEPVARLERLADLEGNARDDIPEQILHGPADDADDNCRGEQHAPTAASP